MSRPADGLLAALRDAEFVNAYDEEHAARVVSRWLADHLDALAKNEKGRTRAYLSYGDGLADAADEVRAAGGVA